MNTAKVKFNYNGGKVYHHYELNIDVLVYVA